MDSGFPLKGRIAECRALDRLLDGVRAGNSGTLVVRGEPGIGKTALLEHAIASGSDLRVLRAGGIESEVELAFAGLHQLCSPLLGHVDRLPDPQQRALSIAFGTTEGEAPDRFIVGLAALSLLSEAAEDQPLLCAVDDAQWLDDESALALTFVARRVLAEAIAIVFVTREPMQGLDGLPEIEVRGLAAADAQALLATGLPGLVDEQVRDRIVLETRGNPLALSELPHGLSAAELAGGFGVPEEVPLTARIEDSFLRRLETLRPEVGRLLLVAAAEPLGDVALLWRAAGHLGLGMDAAEPAETAGLIELGARVRFRHPLVRSAIYRGAAPADRREAHRALAEATDPESDPDRRAWHRAQAAGGPDEEVAGELERSAGRAAGRGGVAASAAFLQRAAELTPDATTRGARALAAARAKFEAGAPDAALELIAVAEMSPLDELQRALLARLRAEISFALSRGSEAPSLLLDAAGRLDRLDPAMARATYLEAIGAAMFAGGLQDDSAVRKTAAAARAAPAAPDPPRSIDLILDGVATRVTEGPAAGAPVMRAALDAFKDEPLNDHAEAMLWLLLCPVAQTMAVFELWDDTSHRELAARAVGLARRHGALALLPSVLLYQTGAHIFAGELSEASALVEENDTITAATGYAKPVYDRLNLAMFLGAGDKAIEQIDAAVAEAMARGEGRVLTFASLVKATVNNALGRYDAALECAQRGSEDEGQGHAGYALCELVEAAVRSGTPEVAATALKGLEERTEAAGTDWALGVLARSRALASEDEAAEELYREAIERLARTHMAVDLARAQLLYGEWLRRQSRRVDAREQLRTAHDSFSRFGAENFAERARRELQATGEKARKRTPETRDALTPQEAQIARLAREGLSNPDIGAQLFISPRTVQYHLGKVFSKLEIKSRNQLAAVDPRVLDQI